jgi:Asp-tRNA(Asn)/Glu-tRNA(Gln) amidotransferase A subunit family amidase
LALKLADRARKAARNADNQLAKGAGGPLCGLPVTIKDSQWLAGVPCANGSRALKDFIPDQTSAAVARLEAAGAVIFAKTTCPELSLRGITESEFYGRTANPWNPERTAGGSSGGAAVAVAVGAGTLSLGGDGGGSIRIPAAFCGVVGFKPTFGVVAREPCFPSWQTIVSYGPLARTVADARLMFSAISTDTNRDRLSRDRDQQISALKGQKLIVSEDLGSAPVNDDVRAVFQQTLGELEAAGAELIFDHPQLPSSVITWAITATYDSWRHQADKSDSHEELEHGTREIMAFGSQFSEQDFAAAQAHRDVIRRAYAEMFERTGAQVMITPTLGCEAFPHGPAHPERIGNTLIEYPWIDWAGFLYDANLTGMPACALPMGLGDEGLPLSLQVTAPMGSDEHVLAVSEQIEAAISWRHPNPWSFG